MNYKQIKLSRRVFFHTLFGGFDFGPTSPRFKLSPFIVNFIKFGNGARVADE
jgi:hypothetical protein